MCISDRPRPQPGRRQSGEGRAAAAAWTGRPTSLERLQRGGYGKVPAQNKQKPKQTRQPRDGAGGRARQLPSGPKAHRPRERSQSTRMNHVAGPRPKFGFALRAVPVLSTARPSPANKERPRENGEEKEGTQHRRMSSSEAHAGRKPPFGGSDVAANRIRRPAANGLNRGHRRSSARRRRGTAGA